MIRRHLVIAGCAALVMLTPAMTIRLAAQGKWWTSEKYKQRLGLTTEQTQRCEQIFQAMAPRLRAAKQALEREEERFSELLKRSDSPESKITEAIDTLEVKVPFVVRLVGTNEEEGRRILAEANLITATSLADAAQKAVAAAQGGTQ